MTEQYKLSTSRDHFLEWLNISVYRYRARVDIDQYKKVLYLHPNYYLAYFLFTDNPNNDPYQVVGVVKFWIQTLSSETIQVQVQYVTAEPPDESATNRFESLRHEIIKLFTTTMVERSPIMGNLSSLQKEILQVMSEMSNGIYPINSKPVAEKLGMEPQMLLRHLYALQSFGYVSIIEEIGNSDNRIIQLTGTGNMELLNPDFSKASLSSMAVNFFGTANIALLNAGQLGSIQTINQHLGTLEESGNQDVAEALKKITEAVIAQRDELGSEEQTEVLEMLEGISKQASLPAEQRQRGIIKPLIAGLVTTIGTTGSLADIWSVWGPAILNFFGIVNKTLS